MMKRREFISLRRPHGRSRRARSRRSRRWLGKNWTKDYLVLKRASASRSSTSGATMTSTCSAMAAWLGAS